MSFVPLNSLVQSAVRLSPQPLMYDRRLHKHHAWPPIYTTRLTSCVSFQSSHGLRVGTRRWPVGPPQRRRSSHRTLNAHNVKLNNKPVEVCIHRWHHVYVIFPCSHIVSPFWHVFNRRLKHVGTLSVGDHHGHSSLGACQDCVSVFGICLISLTCWKPGGASTRR